MPRVSNGKMISALKDSHFFWEILKLAQNQFPDDGILKIYNPQIEMFARFKMKSSFHKTKRII